MLERPGDHHRQVLYSVTLLLISSRIWRAVSSSSASSAALAPRMRWLAWYELSNSESTRQIFMCFVENVGKVVVRPAVMYGLEMAALTKRQTLYWYTFNVFISSADYSIFFTAY